MIWLLRLGTNLLPTSHRKSFGDAVRSVKALTGTTHAWRIALFVAVIGGLFANARFELAAVTSAAWLLLVDRPTPDYVATALEHAAVLITLGAMVALLKVLSRWARPITSRAACMHCGYALENIMRVCPESGESRDEPSKGGKELLLARRSELVTRRFIGSLLIGLTLLIVVPVGTYLGMAVRTANRSVSWVTFAKGRTVELTTSTASTYLLRADATLLIGTPMRVEYTVTVCSASDNPPRESMTIKQTKDMTEKLDVRLGTFRANVGYSMVPLGKDAIYVEVPGKSTFAPALAPIEHDPPRAEPNEALPAVSPTG